MTDPLLRTEELTKSFGGLEAVSKVTMAVRTGEIHGLVGPNGAGKTSLLNLISGFYPPTTGRIFLRSEDITGRPSHHRAGLGIARTFQTPQLFNEMTALDNAAAGRYRSMRNGAFAALLGGRALREDLQTSRESALEVLEFVGLRHVWEVQARHLSYGQRKVLEVARALAARPQLVLLDEPAAGLNPTEVAALNDLIVKMNNAGISVVVVEHNMRVIMNVCHHVTVLNFGEQIASGTPAEVQQDVRVLEAYLGRRR